MKIAEASVRLASERTSVERHDRKEQLRMWRDGREPVTLEASNQERSLSAEAEAAAKAQGADLVKLSPEAQATQPSKRVAPGDIEIGPLDELKMSLVRMMVEAVTGQQIQFLDPRELQANPDQASGGGSTQAPPGTGQTAQQDRLGWGVSYDYYETHYESEQTSFSAQGVIKTADGREISFNAQLNMSREFMSQQHISLRAGDALKDPLVVNFNGSAAELTQRDFSFDIDADGRKDQIAFVAPGSGFLALDKNGDGQVNDGNELFGAQSGNGFADLAKYDDDHNQWIDENDSIYTKLRIWSRDAQGNDSLLGLGQQGVGAIYLGHIGTSFDIKSSANELQGQVKSSGVFLNENGSVGTVQQIDLVA